MKNLILLLAILVMGVAQAQRTYYHDDLNGCDFSSVEMYSYKTGNYYYVDVEFDGDEVTIYVNNGYVYADIEDDYITEGDSFDIYFYSSGFQGYGELEIDDFDECS